MESFEALPEEDRKSVAEEIVRRSVGPDRREEDLLRLSVADRIQLVEDLWDSIAAEAAELPFTEEEWAEIQRRRAEHALNPASAIPWEEVRARLHRRFA
jgi:putative addiction module component (TIGR02574 family)